MIWTIFPMNHTNICTFREFMLESRLAGQNKKKKKRGGKKISWSNGALH